MASPIKELLFLIKTFNIVRRLISVGFEEFSKLKKKPYSVTTLNFNDSFKAASI